MASMRISRLSKTTINFSINRLSAHGNLTVFYIINPLVISNFHDVRQRAFLTMSFVSFFLRLFVGTISSGTAIAQLQETNWDR